MSHQHACECFRCKYGPEAANLMTKKLLDEYGWYAQYITDACEWPNHINFHTIGIKEKFKHPDFQICFPVMHETGLLIFHKLVAAITNGQTFQAGDQMYEDILGGGYKLKFIEARENDRQVLRLIFPNPSHGYTGTIYEAQFNNVDEDPAISAMFTRPSIK